MTYVVIDYRVTSDDDDAIRAAFECKRESYVEVMRARDLCIDHQSRDHIVISFHSDLTSERKMILAEESSCDPDIDNVECVITSTLLDGKQAQWH